MPVITLCMATTSTCCHVKMSQHASANNAALWPAHALHAQAGQLPTTNKHSSMRVSGPPPAHHPASHSPTETAKLPVPPAPYVIPCCTAEWPELDIPVLQQQQADDPAAQQSAEPVLHVEQASTQRQWCIRPCVH